MVVVNDEEKILNFLSAHDPTKLLFWVGTGVSDPQLPLGIPLTWTSMEFICGPRFSHSLARLWVRVNELIENGSGRKAALGPLPRLESVLAEIVGIQGSLKDCRYDFLSGLKAFNSAPVNLKHMALAKMIDSGSTIITTNFDNCIQRAYEELFGRQMSIAELYGINYYEDPKGTGGRIWHLHGTAERLESVRVVVEQLKLINSEFQRYLNKIFDDGVIIIFVGYSASDAFDVTPYFLSKAKDTLPNSKALFIQHGEDENKVPVNLEKMLRGFGDHLIGLGDTERILVSLLTSQGMKIPSGHVNSWDWKHEFRWRVNFEDAARVNAFITLGIAHRLGINIDAIEQDQVKRAKSVQPFITKKFYHDRLALTHDDRSSRWGQFKHTFLTRPEKRHFIHVLNSFGLHSISQRHGKTVEQLEQMAESNKILVWDYEYTDLASHCRAYINKYLSTKVKEIKPEDLPNIKRLANISFKLGFRDLDKVIYINQLATALRFNLVLDALAGRPLPRSDVIETIFEYYSENSSVDGWTGAFRDLAIAALFRHKYHGDAYDHKISKYLGSAWTLAIETMDGKEIRILRKIEKVLKEAMAI